MIDYEKLKLLHELADKAGRHLCYGLASENGCSYKAPLFLDGLIEELQELTRAKPKYEQGQKLWRLNEENEPVSFFIIGIEKYISGACGYMDEHMDWWDENHCYSTRRDLIEAQIEHWSLKLVEESESFLTMPKFEGAIVGFKPECEHECGDTCPSVAITDEVGIVTYSLHKCKKCGVSF